MKNNESLGSESFHELGFKSKEELNKEIVKLIQLRSEYKKNIKSLLIR